MMFYVILRFHVDTLDDVKVMATPTLENLLGLCQSQNTQGLCIAEFGTLSDERGSRSKIFLLFNMDKRTLISKI